MDWTLWQSDHAAVKYSMRVPLRTKKRRSTFQPSSDEALQEWLRNNVPGSEASRIVSIEGQARNQSEHNASTRTGMRLSTQARFYYGVAARAINENQRRGFLRQAAGVRAQEATRAGQQKDRRRF